MANVRLAQIMETIDITRQRFGLAIAVGAGVGVLTWLLSLGLQAVFIEPVFCRSADSFEACANGGTISIAIAATITGALGLFGLVKLGIYRPLLVVLASLITLFGVHAWLGAMSWYEASLWYGLLGALTYGLYAWIARLTSFEVSLGVMVVVIVILRLLMAQL